MQKGDATADTIHFSSKKQAVLHVPIPEENCWTNSWLELVYAFLYDSFKWLLEQ